MFDELAYLNLLSTQYTSINKVCIEIINLQAILNLPKGTEHFVSDIHGEYEAFNHVLKNASGVVKDYINELFGTALRENEKRNLATLIYYPELKLESVKRTEHDMNDWYKITLFRLIQVCKRVSSKYTRSKVRKALPAEFDYILEELIHEGMESVNKQEYYNEIIDTIIRLGQGGNFVTAISNLIHRLAIDHLHIIGDIYDRGKGAEKIMDILANYHSIDVQWGNHDILWMGAASGSEACICNVIRISSKYNNLATIEEGYGINLVPLASFAMEHYDGCDCESFMPDCFGDKNISGKEKDLVSRMHKAITIIQFKVEAEVIKRNPDFKMEDMLLLDKIDLNKKQVTIEGIEYDLTDAVFPTINPDNPFELTVEEKSLLEKIKYSFLNSTNLQEHIRFLFNKGSMYKIYNNNLLFHGCIPLNPDGSLKNVSVKGKIYYGKELLDELERITRQGFYAKEDTADKQYGLDMMWYLWCGNDSPVYGKNKMTTFERYFTADESLYEEKKDPYYDLRNDESMCERIMEDFGREHKIRHIINGHVPVRVVKGESPVKANGKMLVIDGGFARAYQKVTGIAGYTLIYNSRGMMLAAHEPFDSMEEAIENSKDIISSTSYLERNQVRQKVGDTDSGRELKIRLMELERLVLAYREGTIKEKK